MPDSNRRPSGCKPDALPTELMPRARPSYHSLTFSAHRERRSSAPSFFVLHFFLPSCFCSYRVFLIPPAAASVAAVVTVPIIIVEAGAVVRTIVAPPPPGGGDTGAEEREDRAGGRESYGFLHQGFLHTMKGKEIKRGNGDAAHTSLVPPQRLTKISNGVLQKNIDFLACTKQNIAMFRITLPLVSFRRLDLDFFRRRVE